MENEKKGLPRSAIIGTVVIIGVYYLLFGVVTLTGKSFVTGIIVNMWYFVLMLIGILLAYIFIPKEEQGKTK